MHLRWLLTLLILFWLGAVHRSAVAAASAPRVVTVILAGSDPDVAHLSSLLGVTLNAEHVRVRTRRVERIAPEHVSRVAHPEANTFARLWLDCTAPERTRLYLTTPDASRIFVREFTFEHGLDATALELLAFVSRNSIVALLLGDEVGVAREEYERTITAHADKVDAPAAPVPPTRSEKSRTNAAGADHSNEWHLAASYELEALGASTIEHGPGAALEWEASRLSLGLAAQVRFPVQIGNGPIRARLVSRSARLFVARPLRLSASASFSFSAALGFDWIRVEPESSQDSAIVNSSFSVAEALARASAGFRYRISTLELGLHTGIELGLVPARYRVMLASGSAENVFMPWRLRPFGALTLGGHW